MFRPRFGGPGEIILREAWMQSLLLFNPGVTFYAAWRETQVLPACEGRQNELSKEICK